MFQFSGLGAGNILATAKLQYYNNKLKECKDNQSTIFGVVNKVLHLSQTVVLKLLNLIKTWPRILITFSIKK